MKNLKLSLVCINLLCFAGLGSVFGQEIEPLEVSLPSSELKAFHVVKSQDASYTVTEKYSGIFTYILHQYAPECSSNGKLNLGIFCQAGQEFLPTSYSPFSVSGFGEKTFIHFLTYCDDDDRKKHMAGGKEIFKDKSGNFYLGFNSESDGNTHLKLLPAFDEDVLEVVIRYVSMRNMSTNELFGINTDNKLTGKDKINSFISSKKDI